MASVDLLVARSDIAAIRVEPAPDLACAEGQVRVRPELFGLTANNVTYAVFGERMRYWDFFPTADPADGRVPVWGFAVVEESAHPDVAVGERLYGYLPMSSQVLLAPGRVRPGSFHDAAPHRAALPAAYQAYQAYQRLPAGAPAPDEGLQALLRPLFITSWLIADQLAAKDYGADAVLLASASSKTAVGTAAVLADNGGGPVVGLTSPANAEFCRQAGVYDQVLTYQQVPDLDPSRRWALVDMAGSAAVRAAVHRHLADSLVVSLVVGATHWDAEPGSPRGLPGPAPVFFFAPDRIAERTQEWGAAEFARRQQAAWSAFAATTDRWLETSHAVGAQAVVEGWQDLVANRVPPQQGHTFTL